MVPAEKFPLASRLTMVLTEFPWLIVLVVAIFFCQIVFGVYGMVIESRERRQGAVHA